MDLEQIRTIWDHNAKRDAAYSVLSVPGKQTDKWSDEAFFATGRVNIDAIEHYLRALGVEAPRGDALDFGCGLGRLSRALAERCASVVGVDISKEMVAAATARNTDRPNCRFVTNFDATLGKFAGESVDFVLSLIVLQHVPRPLAKQYLAAFTRILKPGGVLVFQLPSHRRLGVKNVLRAACPESVMRLKHRLGGRSAEPYIPMFPWRRAACEQFLRDELNLRLLGSEPDIMAGADLYSFKYFAQKPRL